MNKLLSKTFGWMSLGLLVTFLTGFLVSMNANMLQNIFGGINYVLFVILELILVITLSARIFKMKSETVKIMFLLYSFVTGLTFSSIFVYYDINSIIIVFLISAILFGILAIVGYKTKIDLTKYSVYFFGAIIAILIISILNIFLKSGTLEFIISIVSVITFLAITAHDIKKLKILERANLPKDNLAIYGALELYLDFINIFVNLLNLFGSKDE